MLRKNNLTPLQKQTVSTLIEKQKFACWFYLGAGKTIIGLTAIQRLLLSQKLKVLIVAPLNVCKLQYTSEPYKWEHTKNLKFANCTGSEKQRIQALNSKADINVINCDNVVWLFKKLLQIRNKKTWQDIKKLEWHSKKKMDLSKLARKTNLSFFDIILIDESFTFKNQASYRTKAMFYLSRNTKYIWLLSGLPNPNGLMDLWAQYFLLDRGKRLGHNITFYRNTYFFQKKCRFTWYAFSTTRKIIYEKVKDISKSSKGENSSIQSKKINEYVMLPYKVKSFYDKLEKEFVAFLEDEKYVVKTAVNKMNKLLQICNGGYYKEEGFEKIHIAKVDALVQLLENNQAENFLIAYKYKFDIDIIQSKIPEAVVLKTEKNIKEWNEGKIKILLAHPQSSGYGLNLQFGGSILVWFGATWDYNLYAQMNGRLARRGQKETVRIIHLIVKGSLEEKVLKVLEKKKTDVLDLINNLK